MISDYDRLWHCIPGYNGYQYDMEDHLLRSMKCFNSYPQGKLIRRHQDKIGTFFYLSNNQNERVKVYEEHIQRLIRNDKNPIICRTWETDYSSRNKLVPTKRQKENKNYVGIPKFTIVDSDMPKYKPKFNGIYFY